jgi:hypothetical protein
MIRRLSTQRWMWPMVLLSILAILAAAHTAQGQGATVRLEAPSKGLKVGGEPFDVAVVVDDVTNLGAFEFQLTYDQGIVELQDVQNGPFLASSGRQVNCLPPDKAPGTVLLRCVTLGATPDGPNGSGTLATVTFRALGAGTSPLHFGHVILTDPPANILASGTEDASVTIEPKQGGFRWVVWGPVIGAVAVVLVVGSVWYTRRRSLP